MKIEDLKLLMVFTGNASDTKYICFDKVAAYSLGYDFNKLMFIITDRNGFNFTVDLSHLIKGNMVDTVKVMEYICEVRDGLLFKCNNKFKRI